jgi:uncharacterized membrane protein HdeD (DUF308 family)
MEDVRRFWWAFLVTALVTIIAGILLLAWTEPTLLVIAVITGVALICFGILEVANAVIMREIDYWWVYLVRGVISFAMGIVLVVWPGPTVYVLAVLLGIYLIFIGLVEFILSVILPDVEHRFVTILLGIAVIFLGIILIADPDRSLKLLVSLFGIALIVFGALEFGAAIALRSEVEREMIEASGE